MLAEDIKAYLDNPIDPADKKLLGLATDLDTKKRVKEAVMLLLRFAPARYRIFALQCEGAPTQARISQLNASLMAVYRQVSRYGNLDNMKREEQKMVSNADAMVGQVEATLDKAEEKPAEDTANSDKGSESSSGSAPRLGKRPDHDSLPRKIQAIYEDNLNILQSQRSAHERAKVLVRQLEKMIEEGKPICDIEEGCHTVETTVKEIMDLNDKRIYNWSVYDNYDPDDDKYNENGLASVVRPLSECDDEALRKYLRKASLKLVKHQSEPASQQWYETAKEGALLRIEELKKRGVVLDPTTPVGKRLRDCGLI